MNRCPGSRTAEETEIDQIRPNFATAGQALAVKAWVLSIARAAMYAPQDHVWEQARVAHLCTLCLNDAGHQCGMMGAARCRHIEASDRGMHPLTWQAGVAGSWCCSDFEPDQVLAESGH